MALQVIHHRSQELTKQNRFYDNFPSINKNFSCIAYCTQVPPHVRMLGEPHR